MNCFALFTLAALTLGKFMNFQFFFLADTPYPCPHKNPSETFTFQIYFIIFMCYCRFYISSQCTQSWSVHTPLPRQCKTQAFWTVACYRVDWYYFFNIWFDNPQWSEYEIFTILHRYLRIWYIKKIIKEFVFVCCKLIMSFPLIAI